MKNILTESTKSKFKVLEHKPANVLKRIQGVLSDFKSNRNGRIYPRELWENVLNSDYVKEMIESHGLVGELDHPEERLEISLQNVSHVINDMWIEGDQVMGTIDILPTPSGKIVSELLDYGTDIGISSRGAGSVGAGNIVDPDYQFVTFDFVARPSCEAARLNMIVEGVQVEIDNNSDAKVNNILENYKQGLKEDTKTTESDFETYTDYSGERPVEKQRHTMSYCNMAALDMCHDALSDELGSDWRHKSLSDIEDIVHSTVYKYNEANVQPEYEEEDFYGDEANAREVYQYILDNEIPKENKTTETKPMKESVYIIKQYAGPFGAYNICEWEADSPEKAVEEFLEINPSYKDGKYGAIRAELKNREAKLTEAVMSDQEVFKVVLEWYKDNIESGKMTLNQCYELLSDKAKVSLNKMVDQSKIKESMINNTINTLIKESIELNKKS